MKMIDLVTPRIELALLALLWLLLFRINISGSTYSVFDNMELQLKFINSGNSMSQLDNISNDLTAYLSDSDDESLFYVKKRQKAPISIPAFQNNRRILPRGCHWTRQEKERYITFLKVQFDLMERPVSERRILKIYWLMSGSIKSKNYAQCRIRHSRLLRRYGSNEAIIRACERELNGVNGRLEKMQQYRLQVEVDEEAGQECCVDENGLWDVLEASQQSYFQNTPALQTSSLF